MYVLKFLRCEIVLQKQKTNQFSLAPQVLLLSTHFLNNLRIFSEQLIYY